MSYSTAIDTKQQAINVVAKIDGEYYAKRQPDSGLTIPSTNLILDDVTINGTTVDIRNVNTPVGSSNFKLKDEDAYISTAIMQDANNFLEKNVEIFVGQSFQSFDFSDYKKVANVRINKVTKIQNGYSIIAKEVTSLITNPTYNINDALAINIIPISTSLDLESAEAFPDSGLLRINNEFIRYNGKTDNTLENLSRGEVGTTATNHDEGAAVYLVTELIDTNPIDMILQLLLSKNGDLTNDATYDVLKNGLGLTTDTVDVATFEANRDAFFLGEQFRLYMFNENDTLRFIERELLRATNSRLFSDDGKISMAVLDQVDVTAGVVELDENSIEGTPTWTLGSDKIINVVTIRWDYDDASRTYLKTNTFKDDESIGVFTEKKPLQLNFRGIKANLGGSAIVANRAQRLLSRLATPRGSITVNAHFDKSEISIGDNLLLTHRFLPKQGASLGISDQLEVISKNIDLRQARVKLKLEYTSFTGIRIPFIAPSPLISSVIDQRTFTVPDGNCYRPGHALKLWNDETSAFYPDNINLIESVDGNTITMAADFTTPLDISIRIRLADYNNVSTDQKNRYAFVGDNSGTFDDGTKSYQILF